MFIITYVKGAYESMKSRVSFREIIAMFFVIISFATTGIFIINENYKCALGGLASVAFFVMIGFIVVMADDSDKILDLSNQSLRNPRKSGTGSKVQYISGITPDMKIKKTKGKNNKKIDYDLNSKGNAKKSDKNNLETSDEQYEGSFSEDGC